MIVVVIYIYYIRVYTGISFRPQPLRRCRHNHRLSTNEKAVFRGFCKNFIVLISLKSLYWLLQYILFKMTVGVGFLCAVYTDNKTLHNRYTQTDKLRNSLRMPQHEYLLTDIYIAFTELHSTIVHYST